MKPLPTKPSKNDIHRFFKSLPGNYRIGTKEEAEAKRLDEEASRIEDEVRKSPRLLRAIVRAEVAGNIARRKREAVVARIAKVRREYYAKGITPQTLRNIATLADFINSVVED